MREKDEFNPDDYRMRDRVLYSGSMVWKKTHRAKGVSLVVYILNTHLILALKRRRLGGRKYYVFCRPIPLEFLDVVSVNPSLPPPATIKGRRPESDAVFSFQIRHIGMKDHIWRLYTSNDHFRSEWLNQLSSALEIREMSTESRRAFQLEEVDLRLAERTPEHVLDARDEVSFSLLSIS